MVGQWVFVRCAVWQPLSPCGHRVAKLLGIKLFFMHLWEIPASHILEVGASHLNQFNDETAVI
jgi:hypothetical protein